MESARSRVILSHSMPGLFSFIAMCCFAHIEIIESNRKMNSKSQFFLSRLAVDNPVVVFIGSITVAAIVFAVASFIAWAIVVALVTFGGSRLSKERARQLAMWTSFSGMLWLGSIRYVTSPD